MPLIDIALVYRDGRREVVTVGRPADLIAFADTFEKIAPSEPYAVRELVWLAHRVLGVEQPLDDWVETLDDLTTAEADVEAIRVEQAGQDPQEAAGEAADVDETPPATLHGIESHA